jgi:hypothetical protein
MSPKRIQMTRSKPWRPENPEAVIVSRGSKWGNPFRVGKPIPKVWLHMELDRGDTEQYLGDVNIPDRAEAVRLYEKYAAPDPSAGGIAELRGRDLACWCPIDQPCHADVLLRLANEAMS